MSAAMPEQANKLKTVPPRIRVHSFSSEVCGSRIIFEILKFKESLLVYVASKGSEDLNDLSLGVKNRYDQKPASTRIVGDFMDQQSLQMAARLTKKLDKSVFVSFNVNSDQFNYVTLPLIEKQLYLEIQNKPDKF